MSAGGEALVHEESKWSERWGSSGLSTRCAGPAAFRRPRRRAGAPRIVEASVKGYSCQTTNDMQTGPSIRAPQPLGVSMQRLAPLVARGIKRAMSGRPAAAAAVAATLEVRKRAGSGARCAAARRPQNATAARATPPAALQAPLHGLRSRSLTRPSGGAAHPPLAAGGGPTRRQQLARSSSSEPASTPFLRPTLTLAHPQHNTRTPVGAQCGQHICARAARRPRAPERPAPGARSTAQRAQHAHVSTACVCMRPGAAAPARTAE